MSENTPPKRSTLRIIARNTIFGAGAQVVLRIANFIFNVLVIRTLGSDEFGQYSIILAWAGLFSVIGDLGINQYLARETAREPENAKNYFWDTVVLRLILGLLAAAVTTGGAILLTDYTPEIILGIAIYTSTYLLAAFLAPLQSVLVGNERLDITAVLGVINQVLFMILAGLFLFLQFDFIGLVVASLLIMPIMIFLHVRSLRRNQLPVPAFKINPSMWISVVRFGLPFAIIQLSLSFANQIDTIYLSAYNTNEVVGWYNTAYFFTLSLMTIARTFNDAIAPTLAREHSLNPESIPPWYYTSVRVIFFVSVPIAVGGSILSAQIINFVYGPEFLPASIALTILIWSVPILMYDAFCGNMTTAIKREKNAAYIFTTVGIVNVAVDAILVPRFGLIGTAFATLLATSTGAFLFYFLFRNEFGAGLGGSRLARGFLAAALMGVVVYLLRDVNLLITIGAGGLTYIIAFLLLRAFTDEERAQIIRLVNRRLRPSHA